MRSVVAPLAFLLALTAGCGGDDGNGTVAAGEAASFAGTPWVLAAGLDVDGWEAAPPSATFADETVGGSTGCNRFTGPVQRRRRLARDRDACVDQDGLCTAGRRGGARVRLRARAGGRLALGRR